MTTSSTGRRKDVRREYFGHIEGTVDGSTFYGTGCDIGTGGMSFDADYILRTGSKVRLAFKVFEKDRQPVQLSAEVVWVQPVHLLFRRVGVRFTEPGPERTAAIEAYLAHSKHPPEQAKPGEEVYPLLGSSFQISGLKLRNRLTMPPMFWGYAGEDGTVSRMLIDAYREIASGGVSMIVVANAVVDQSGVMGSRVVRIDDDRFIAGLAKLADAIRAEGAVTCLQLNHAGCWAKVEKPLSPSPAAVDVPSGVLFSESFRKELSGRDQMKLMNEFVSRMMRCRGEMTLEEIRWVEESFGKAAIRAKEAGFEMVELHGATGYLLSQFVSPRSNRRLDGYGGSIENRMRFPLEVLRTVRESVGSGFPVGYRLLADEWLDGGFDLQQARIFAQKLEEGGVAYLSVATGTYESFFLPRIMNESRKEGYIAPYARAIKAAAPNTPIIASGRITKPLTAEEILEHGDADLIGLARSLFADPLWPRKALEGRDDEIVFCVSCNTCFHRVLRDQPAICARWDKKKKSAFDIEVNRKRDKWGKILIAMDDSARSLEAVEYAAQMIRTGKRITLLSVVTNEHETEADRKNAEQVLVQARRILVAAGLSRENIEVRVIAKKDGVAEDILREVNTGGYGSIIIGRRGLSRVRQLLFGSVSHEICHHAKDCAVWVID